MKFETISSNFELKFKASSLGAQSVGILFESRNPQASCTVEYSFVSQELTSRSVDALQFKQTAKTPEQLVEDSESIGFHIFVDGSLVEVFLSTGEALSLRVYRSGPEAIYFCSFSGDSQLESIRKWELGSTWN